MRVLGIETSCDDTAAAVLEDGRVLSSVVSSQDDVHGPFGGIVPELASRRHLENVLPVLHQALSEAGVGLEGIDGIAVTRGPGLMGSLLVGLSTAKGLALENGLPLVGVNHLEGHLLAIFLDRPIEFPYVGLLVSGGHTSLYVVEEPGRYREIGRTVDDAAGEAFDKAAIRLGLGFPGGKVIDDLARGGNPARIRFPRARVRENPWAFSFSGLKTALREVLAGRETHVVDPGFRVADGAPPTGRDLADLAAAFQDAVVDVLVRRSFEAAEELGVPRIVVSGGVSANSELRRRMQEAGDEAGVDVAVPSFRYCTDNAAMIAYAGGLRLARGEADGPAIDAVASWPVGRA